MSKRKRKPKWKWVTTVCNAWQKRYHRLGLRSQVNVTQTSGKSRRVEPTHAKHYAHAKRGKVVAPLTQ